MRGAEFVEAESASAVLVHVDVLESVHSCSAAAAAAGYLHHPYMVARGTSFPVANSYPCLLAKGSGLEACYYANHGRSCTCLVLEQHIYSSARCHVDLELFQKRFPSHCWLREEVAVGWTGEPVDLDLGHGSVEGLRTVAATDVPVEQLALEPGLAHFSN